MHTDADRCYAAVNSRDGRFDGRFVTAVRTTGIYCRPSCPAQTPKRENVSFLPTAAAAVAAGYRACRRCRPDAAPGSPDWNTRGDLAARALRGIADGIVDTDGVPGLARRLAVSERHLHRVLVAEVGVGPLALARTRRAQTARMLVEHTALPLTDVAFAAGFSSIRQFNDVMQTEFGVPPRDLRRARGRSEPPGTGELTLRLAHRPPYDVPATLGWLRLHAVAGVEEVEAGSYRRSLPDGGVIELTPAATHTALRLRVDDVTAVAATVARCRRLLDADADPAAVDDALGADPMLARHVSSRPGLRSVGAVDGFEATVRAVVAQQVSTAGAVTLTARLVASYGKPLDTPSAAVTHLFPTADALADASYDGIGLTGSRIRTLRALAAAHAVGDLPLDPAADRDETRAALLSLPGIGPWTTEVVAMRALGDPDAFPAGDLVLRRAATADDAARWRPWRSYAAQHLWVDHLTSLGTLSNGAPS